MFDDVLEAMGVTPRELGPLQVAIERAEAQGPHARVRVLVQAAFNPAKASLVLRCGESRVELPTPPLDDGSAWRLTIPLAATADEVQLSVDSMPVSSKRRIRTAWKLTDTYAQERRETVPGDARFAFGISSLGLASFATLASAW